MVKRVLLVIVVVMMAHALILSVLPVHSYMYKVSDTAVCNHKQVAWTQLNKKEKSVAVWFGAAADSNMVKWNFDTLTEAESFFSRFKAKLIEVNGGDY